MTINTSSHFLAEEGNTPLDRSVFVLAQAIGASGAPEIALIPICLGSTSAASSRPLPVGLRITGCYGSEDSVGTFPLFPQNAFATFMRFSANIVNLLRQRTALKNILPTHVELGWECAKVPHFRVEVWTIE